MVDRAAGGGEQHHLVGLALDPRVLDVDLGRGQPADLLARLGERGEAVVHDRLLDPHRVGAVVAHVQLDLAGLEHGALDGQLLLRHADAVEPGRVERHEQPDRRGEHDERRQARRASAAAPRAGGGGGLHQSTTSKKPIQPELRELGHVGVEHVLAGVGEAQLEDAALALALDDRVGEVARLEPGAGRVVVEEVGVDVERVDEVELEHVHEVDPHELAALDPDRLVHVRERDRVDGVDLVRAVEVGVEPVHDHDELVGGRAAVLRVDHERAVEALGDVLGERGRVAVVEVQAERRGVELVDGRLARLDVAGADARDAVHHVAVDAVEVDRVRVARAVREADPQPLALARAQRRAGHAPVVGPGGVLDAGRHLDLAVLGDDVPLAHAAAHACPRRSRAGSRAGRSRWPVRSTRPTAPRWPEPRCACGGARPRPAAAEVPPCRPWCGISSCSTGSAAPVAAAPPSSLRRETLFSHNFRMSPD